MKFLLISVLMTIASGGIGYASEQASGPNYCQLIAAIDRGDVNEVADFFQAHPQTNLEEPLGKSGNTAFLHAVEKGKVNIAEFLLQQGAAFFAVNKSGKMAENVVQESNKKWVEARKKSEFNRVATLINEKKPPREIDALLKRTLMPVDIKVDGTTLVHIATSADNTDALKLLLYSFAASTTIKNSEGKYPFEIAIEKRFYGARWHLLQSFHNQSIKIFEAIEDQDQMRGLQKIARLIDKGVNPNYLNASKRLFPNNDNWDQTEKAKKEWKELSPLHFAVLKKHLPALRYLIYQGGDIEVKSTNETPSTLLEYARGLGAGWEEMREEVERFAQEKATDFFRLTPDGHNGPIDSFHRNRVIPLWQRGLSGKGINVMIVDEGITFVGALKDKGIKGGGGYFPSDSDGNAGMIVEIDSQYREWGHGRSMALTLAANPNDSQRGYAPGVKILPMTVPLFLPDGRELQDVSGIFALNDIARMFKNEHPIRIVSASVWGFPGSQVFGKSGTAIDEDLLLVLIAGNGGNTKATELSVGWPLPSPDPSKNQLRNIIVTVALDPFDKLTKVSYQCGATASVCLAVPSNNPTSPTAAVVSGVAALLMEAFPQAKAYDIQQALLESALPLETKPELTGRGKLNAEGAFAVLERKFKGQK